MVAPAALRLTEAPEQIFVVDAFAVTMIAFDTVTVKGIAAEMHPVVLLRTVIKKSYVPSLALEGMVMAIGDAVKLALVIALNPLIALVPAVIEY